MATPRWNQVTEHDAAVILGIKIEEVRALVEAKLLKATYMGKAGGYTISVEELESYIQKRGERGT